jgi:ribA/ribD-fused uncharacterized protein
MTVIKFYRVNEPYGAFSNFYRSPIVVESMVWPTVEHYFQASKFADFRVQDKIREIQSPLDAAKEGRNRDNRLRDDWETVKDIKMHKALTAKFMQHPTLKTQLLNTGNAEIIEHTSNDSYWADGGDGKGKNMLGKLLMAVRDEIRQISDVPDLIFPPWMAFPQTDRLDMFWRMGLGEEYVGNWHNYVDSYDRKKYKLKFPEPEEWDSTY